MNMILDCETISKKYNCISDLAWAMVERNKIVTIKNFIPAEHLPIMPTGEFSGVKMPATLQEVASGNAIIAPWDTIMAELKSDIDATKRIYAYNAVFDRGAIGKTCKALQSEFTDFMTGTKFFNKWRDLWAAAANTILYKKSFIDFCDAHELRTPKQFCSTSAETCLKFIRNNPVYVEAHTARADVLDEFEIYLTIKQAGFKDIDDVCADDVNFKGKPFYTIRKLETAMNS